MVVPAAGCSEAASFLGRPEGGPCPRPGQVWLRNGRSDPVTSRHESRRGSGAWAHPLHSSRRCGTDLGRTEKVVKCACAAPERHARRERARGRPFRGLTGRIARRPWESGSPSDRGAGDGVGSDSAGAEACGGIARCGKPERANVFQPAAVWRGRLIRGVSLSCGVSSSGSNPYSRTSAIDTRRSFRPVPPSARGSLDRESFCGYRSDRDVR